MKKAFLASCALMVFSLVNSSAAACSSYANFNSAAGLALTGVAIPTNGVLRLTPAQDSQTGDAWLLDKQPCAGGFDTSFHFRITTLGNIYGNEPGGDGFTFSVQNLGPTDASWAMGGASNYVSVFFNTFWNWPGCTCPDVSDNSVGILINQTYIAQVDLNPLGIQMSDGAVHQARVSFNGAGMTVWVDGVVVLPNVPIAGLQPGVDNTGQGWVGFTAGTGAAYENHDILDWSFCPTNFPPPPPPCVSAPSGLIGLWRADGNTQDSIGSGNGVAVNAGYTSGIDGQAFAFDPENYPFGTYTGVQITDQPIYALTNSLSIEGWIRPRGDSYIIFWRGDHRPGLDPYALSMQGNHTLLFQISDENGNGASVGAALNYNQWYHVAATLDGVSGTMSVYTNGTLAAQAVTAIRPFGTLIAGDSPGVGIGNLNDGGNNFPFIGDIDEISLYNRALTGSEVQSIFNAGSAGKCPTNSPPPPPSCTPAPSGLVSLWRGENNALDSADGNNGTVQGPVNFVPGEAGQAFDFNGYYSGVQLGNPANLQLQTFTIEAWVKRHSATQGTLDPSHPDNGAFLHYDVGGYAFAPANDGRLLLSKVGVSGVYSSALRLTDTNGFHHVAVTTTGSNVVFYLDGVAESVGSYDPGYTFSGPVAIGGRGGDLAASFYGAIDELSVYSRALSSAEIQALYNAGSAGKCPTNPPPPSCTSAPAGLVSLWRGENNALDSADGNNGTLINGTGFSLGEVGTAFNFDGANDYVEVPSSANLKVTGPFTIEGWINYHGTPNVYSGDTIVAKGVDAETAGDWAITVSENSKLRPHVNAGGGWHYFDCNTVLNPDTWYHIAMVYDGVHLQGYVNGVLDGSVDANGAVQTTDNALRIGAYAPVNGTASKAFFRGQIDELSLYSRALSNSEIAALYSAGSAGKCAPTGTNGCVTAAAGLVGWWPGEGNANDVVGGHDGTLQGGVTFAPGEVGQGFRLDGTNSYVQIPDSAALKPTNVTVEAWVWLDPNAIAPRLDYIIFKKNSWDYLFEGYSLLKQSLPNDDGTFTDRFSFVVSRDGNQVITYSTTVVQRGVWYHVAGTYDGNRLTLWVNGVPEASAIAGFALDYGTLPVFIGTSGQPEPYNGKLAGIIDEAAIYNRALSSNEIAAIYNAGSGGKCPPSSPPPPSVAPLITSFNPTGSAPGTIVEIHGTNFSTIASNNIVYCGAVRAIVLASTPSLLDVMVPSGATYAPLTVTVNGLVAASRTPFQPEFPGGSDVTSSSFAPRVDLPAPNGPIFTAIADLDGDGKPDLIVNNAYAHNLSLYRNISTTGSLDTNSFAAPVNFDVAGGDPDNPYGLAVADVDGDGKPDVVICNRLLSLVTVYRNIATPGSLTTASLAPPVSFPVGTDPRHVAIVDLNGDGKPDMVSANYGANTISLLQNIGSAGTLTSNSFMAAVDLPAGSLPYDIAIGDLDGDGKPDLAVTSDSFVLLYRNTGAGGNLGVGTFQSPAQLPSPSGTGIGIALGDLDGDGKPDLVTCTYLSQTMSVFRNKATPGSLTAASFASEVDFAPGCRGHTVALSDLNGDGQADIGFVGEIPDKFSVYQNVSTPGSFTTGSLAPRVDFPTGYNAWGISIGDLDGDGRPDVVFCNSYDNTISIYRNVMSTGNSTACTPPPFGLVSWWRGEGNAQDSADGNLGTLVNGAGFAAGKVGAAFNFDGTSSYVEVPSSANLKVSGPFTIEGWIKYHGTPNVYSGDTIVAKGIDQESAEDWAITVSENSTLRPHVNSGGIWHYFDCDTVLNPDTWYHIAMVYDGTHVQGYVNGALDGSVDASGAVQTTDGALRIGAYAPVNGTASKAFFHGQIDELSLYNRALSNSEIAALFNAGSAGKCSIPPPPIIVSQPTNRTVYVGQPATFTVTATGTPPLYYQWLLEGVPLPNKTNSAITIFNAQLTDAGNYSVIVSNAVDSVVSSNALLTVNPLPLCTPPPSGLISWWRFENSVLDNWDSNNGTAPDGSSFVDAKVGHGFNFAQRYVSVPDSPSLRPTNGLTIEAWINPNGGILTVSPPHTIFAKSDAPSGFTLSLVNFSYFLGTTNNGRILFCVSPSGTATGSASLSTSQAVPTNQWTFVVATYDGTALRIYLNGTQAAQLTYSNGIFPGTSPVGIGAISTGVTAFTWPFFGIMDEVSIYNRALSPDEIQAIYKSDFIGKCLVAPTITAQPLSQLIPLNEDVKFFVSVLGTRPLKYQWRFNGGNIFGATNSTLILEKLKTNNIGFYTVLVSNSLGSVVSSDAALKLSPPLSCTPPPAGIISWWPADNSYGDAVDGNNASPVNPAFPPFNPTGKVSQAFNLNGTSSRIAVNNSPSLNFSNNANFSIEGWIKALPPPEVTLNPQIYQYPNTPIIEKRTAAYYLTGVGYSLSLNQGRLAFWLGTNSLNLVSNSSIFISSGPDLRDGMFHHVAVTLDRSSTSGGKLFVDGNVVLTFNAFARRGDLTTAGQMFIGAPTAAVSNSVFYGSIDEMAIYNRALATNEIQAIAGAGSAGKCKVPPTIVTQPVSRTVQLGSNATFLVVATGSPNLRYQWFRSGGTIGVPSTNSTLVFSNVTAQVVGTYFVRVTNFFGSVTSSNAVLALAPIAPPANAVLHFGLTGGQPMLQFGGTAGQPYTVQASTNLTDWTVIGTATDLGDGKFEFADPDWTNYTTRYYRIILP